MHLRKGICFALIFSFTIQIYGQQPSSNNNKIPTTITAFTPLHMMGYIGLSALLGLVAAPKIMRWWYSKNQISLTEQEKKLFNETLKKLNLDPAKIHLIATSFPSSPAAAIGTDTIVLDAQSMRAFTSAQQEFILGHEGTHLLHKHNHISVLSVLAGVSSLYFLLKIIDPYLSSWSLSIKNKLEKTDFKGLEKGFEQLAKDPVLANQAITAILSQVGFFLFCLLRRQMEKDADLTAAATLGSGEAGAQVFEKFLSQQGENSKDLFHPPLKKRIAYLRKR